MQSVSRVLMFFFVILFSNFGLALEPTRHSNLNRSFEGGFTLVSTMAKDNDGHNKKGRTEALNSKGKRVWSTPFFIGRHRTQLSADGKAMALTGDFNFPGMISTNEDPVVAEIYINGRTQKKVFFTEIFNKSIGTIVNEKSITTLGGGWASEDDLFKIDEISWKARELHFKIYTGETKIVKY